MSAHSGRMIVMSMMFAPRMLPTDIEDCFLTIAVIAVTSSGSDVPMATMVTAMMRSETQLRQHSAVVDQKIRAYHKARRAEDEQRKIFKQRLPALVHRDGLARRLFLRKLFRAADVLNEKGDEQYQHNQALRQAKKTIAAQKPQHERAENHQNAFDAELAHADDNGHEDE